MLLERAKRKMLSRAGLLSYPFRFWSRKERLNHPTCLTPMLQQKPDKHSLVTQPLGRTESPLNHSCWCAIPRSPELDRPRAGALRDRARPSFTYPGTNLLSFSFLFMETDRATFFLQWAFLVVHSFRKAPAPPVRVLYALL